MKKLMIMIALLTTTNVFAEVITKKCVETKESRENLDYSYNIEVSQSNSGSIHMVIYNLAGGKENLAYGKLAVNKNPKNKSVKYVESESIFNSDYNSTISFNKPFASAGEVKMTIVSTVSNETDVGPLTSKLEIAELVCN